MIRLIAVELTRLRWRRAVLLLLALAVAATAALFVGVVVETRTRTLEDLTASYGPQVMEEVEMCTERPRRYGLRAGDDARARCESQISGWYGNSRLDLVEQREAGSGPALVAILTLLLLLAGTTFVGHDWNTGSMSNQLLFEPRRARVWTAKALAVGLVAGVLGLVVLAAYWSGLWAVTSVRDLPIPDLAVSAAYKQAVLGAAFVAGGAVFGYALTMMLRTTVGSLGLLLGIGLLGIVTVWTGFQRAEAVMPWGNFIGFVIGRYTYYSDGACDQLGCSSVPHVIDRSDGAIYFLVVLLVFAALSVLSFRRRDVP